jgi:hypothetical protein
MKLSTAMKIIDKKCGYLIHFEWIEGSILRTDYFPDVHSGEAPIENESEAIGLAELFADATKGNTCNLYLVRGSGPRRFAPVGLWRRENR